MKACGGLRVRAVGGRLALWLSAFDDGGWRHGSGAVDPICRARRRLLKSGTAQFDAYGRRFSLTLTDNERVLQQTFRRAQAAAAERTGCCAARSMARPAPGCGSPNLRRASKARSGTATICTPSRATSASRRISPRRIDAAPGQTVVYRLSDSRDILPRDFCALADDVAISKASNGLEQYQAVVRGLEARRVTPQLTRQIEISLIADSDSRQRSRRSHGGHAGAPQHRRRHFQRAGRACWCWPPTCA